MSEVGGSRSVAIDKVCRVLIKFRWSTLAAINDGIDRGDGEKRDHKDYLPRLEP